MKYENQRTRDLPTSPSMAVSTRARALRAEGRKIIDLSVGEPDFNTPDHIQHAATEAMRQGWTRYTVPAGSPELRAAIVRKFKRENGLDYAADEITVANGAKQLLFNAWLATLEAGDEVVIPAPYWVSYSDMVSLHGGVPVVLPCPPSQGFKLTPAQLEAAITPRTRWFILNSPCNPTGALYSEAELQALGRVLDAHPDVLIISDEIYEHVLLSDAPFVSFGKACPQLRERLLIINGVSKAYAMTGWRLGYAAGPRGLIAALNKLESQSTTSASGVSQAAAIQALDGPQDFVAASRAEYQARGELTVAGLRRINGLTLAQAPLGAFYAYPECSALIGKKTPDGKVLQTDVDVATYLLESGGVAVVPGAAFGMSPYFRLSFAASREALSEALAAIETAVKALQPA
ncbi:aminotransferase class I/II-fold pyridoxal phosphate-dependent enzyme [Achromobacter kerstersii]|uniref:aminotransferase class I/II-fold pyridoxal phosphate-dependent enzyme n=1 Tax=Achromobacter kerstersii TaxID=1353890 RepID=UPI003D008434